MSEENENSQEGWSGIKKAIIGAITTALTAGGAWFATRRINSRPKTVQAVLLRLFVKE